MLLSISIDIDISIEYIEKKRKISFTFEEI